MSRNIPMPMRTMAAGRQISALGFGCSSRWAQPSLSEEKASLILEAALEHGINHFDTGPSYGIAEERLGNFIRKADRSRLIISTKVGTERSGARSFDHNRIRESLHNSLKRLQTDYIDILYLHGPSILDISETFDLFDTLKRDGKIIYSGVNSFERIVVQSCIHSPIDVIMLQYNIFDRRFVPEIEKLAKAGKIVIAATIMAQGVLDWRTFIPRDKTSVWYLLRALKNDPSALLKGRSTAWRIRDLGLEPNEAAIQFFLSNPYISSGLFGTTNLDHLLKNVQSAKSGLSAEITRSLFDLV